MSETKQLQFAFWQEFAEVCRSSDVPTPSPAAKNSCYVPLGVAGARIVLTMSIQPGEVGCKLDLKPAAHRESLADVLSRDRPRIEAELGFSDLTWWEPTPTRIYRSASMLVANRAGWPAAFQWLLRSAEGFLRVFRPRLVEAQAAAESAGSSRSPQVGNRRGHIEPDTLARLADTPAPTTVPARGHTRPPRIGAVSRPGTSLGTRLAPADDSWVSIDFRRLAVDHDLGLYARERGPKFRTIGLYSPGPQPTYRYAYAEWWEAGAQRLARCVAWVLLNPATGDSDGKRRPILEYCRSRSISLGYSGLAIMNLFAYRDRDPRMLRSADEAVGPCNDTVLKAITAECGLTIVGWGNRGARWNRSLVVRRFLDDPMCLRKNDRDTTIRGEPFHPSRGMRQDAELIRLPHQ